MKNENDDGNRQKRRNEEYIKVVNIYFNSPGLFAFKSNDFSCNLVQNYNVVRKLIPN